MEKKTTRLHFSEEDFKEISGKKGFINNCGNGWSVGRQTANGLMGCSSIIPWSEAKPGDLIFFQETYNTSGA